jgi:hypothetical protein
VRRGTGMAPACRCRAPIGEIGNPPETWLTACPSTRSSSGGRPHTRPSIRHTVFLTCGSRPCPSATRAFFGRLCRSSATR